MPSDPYAVLVREDVSGKTTAIQEQSKMNRNRCAFTQNHMKCFWNNQKYRLSTKQNPKSKTWQSVI